MHHHRNLNYRPQIGYYDSPNMGLTKIAKDIPLKYQQWMSSNRLNDHLSSIALLCLKI